MNRDNFVQRIHQNATALIQFGRDVEAGVTEIATMLTELTGNRVGLAIYHLDHGIVKIELWRSEDCPDVERGEPFILGSALISPPVGGMSGTIKLQHPLRSDKWSISTATEAVTTVEDLVEISALDVLPYIRGQAWTHQ